MKIEITHAFGSKFTPTNKALQLQLVTDYDPANTGSGRGGFGDCFAGPWCVIAPPPVPSLDASGKVKQATEVIGVQVGDQIIALGMRDVRWSKFSADAKPGEVAIFNAFSTRLFLGELSTSLVAAGGAFMNFDAVAKTVGITGYPASPSAKAAYITISTTKIALVSETGAASISVSGNQITESAGSISLNGGTVNLGTGAADPVVTVSKLQAVLSTIVTWMGAHVHSGGTLAGALTGVSASVPLTAAGSSRVNAAI